MMRIQDTHTTFRTSVSLACLALAAVLILPAASQAATVGGLTLSDGTTNFTVVEADHYDGDGNPPLGNTVKTAGDGSGDGSGWSLWNANNGTDNRWWYRDGGIPGGWAGLGGTDDRRFELKGTETCEITTSVSGLAADTYDVYIIAQDRANASYPGYFTQSAIGVGQGRLGM